MTYYLDSSGFLNLIIFRSLIDVTDKFLLDLKDDSIGLQTLCYDRKYQAGDRTTASDARTFTYKKRQTGAEFAKFATLLPLNKVEEVQLVFLKQFFDAEHLVNKVAQLLRNYPDVALKMIRVHSKGARDESSYQHIFQVWKKLMPYANPCTSIWN